MKKYDVIYADPPWFVTPNVPSSGGSRPATGATSHYPVMTDHEMLAFDMKGWANKRAVLFLWATCPRLDFAIQCISEWGFHYRGVGFVWVKTKKTGEPIGAKGGPPTLIKPVVELVLTATTNRRGRPFPIVDFKTRQVIMAPVREHSRKPDEVAERIVQTVGDRSRVELFARQKRVGWAVWGNEIPKNNLKSEESLC